MLFNRKSNRRKRIMSSYKVEICGVNTAKLPVLKRRGKGRSSHASNREMPLPAKPTSRETSASS